MLGASFSVFHLRADLAVAISTAFAHASGVTSDTRPSGTLYGAGAAALAMCDLDWSRYVGTAGWALAGCGNAADGIP